MLNDIGEDYPSESALRRKCKTYSSNYWTIRLCYRRICHCLCEIISYRVFYLMEVCLVTKTLRVRNSTTCQIIV